MSNDYIDLKDEIQLLIDNSDSLKELKANLTEMLKSINKTSDQIALVKLPYHEEEFLLKEILDPSLKSKKIEEKLIHPKKIIDKLDISPSISIRGKTYMYNESTSSWSIQ